MPRCCAGVARTSSRPTTITAAGATAKTGSRGYLDPVLSALNPHLTHHYGMDFGRSVDLSVIATLAVESNLVRRCPFLVELRNVPFKQQEQILFHVLDRLPRFAKGANDARGNGQQLAEFAWQKYGQARVEPVMLSEEWYRSNMPAFQAAFQDSMIQIPRDVDVRDDLRAIKLIKGVGRIPEGYKGKGADGKPATPMPPSPWRWLTTPVNKPRWLSTKSKPPATKPWAPAPIAIKAPCAAMYRFTTWAGARWRAPTY